MSNDKGIKYGSEELYVSTADLMQGPYAQGRDVVVAESAEL
jgi:hypothetical protein